MEQSALNGTTTKDHAWKEKKGFAPMIMLTALLLGLAFYAGQMSGSTVATTRGGPNASMMSFAEKVDSNEDGMLERELKSSKSGKSNDKSKRKTGKNGKKSKKSKSTGSRSIYQNAFKSFSVGTGKTNTVYLQKRVNKTVETERDDRGLKVRSQENGSSSRVEEQGEQYAPRLIAFVGNWQACPSDAQLAQYTHIVIAFAVTYTWSPDKNICSEQCEISTPLTCENKFRLDLIKKWQEQGKKVLLSFGGAGMGGSWVDNVNDCWEYCYGKEDQVVDSLAAIVNKDGYDGIDMDYEYFYQDNQNGSNFTLGTQAQTFLRAVTVGLRKKLPSGKELTQAPMETDMMPHRAYFDILTELAEKNLDFLMPQYYNGYINSYTDFPTALSSFTRITDQMFNGDPNRVVFGFCLGECGPYNQDGDQSAEVMGKLSETYPCNGGAFFWVANNDPNGDWSIPVKNQLEIDSTASCSTGGEDTCVGVKCSDGSDGDTCTGGTGCCPFANTPKAGQCSCGTTYDDAAASAIACSTGPQPQPTPSPGGEDTCVGVTCSDGSDGKTCTGATGCCPFANTPKAGQCSCGTSYTDAADNAIACTST